MDFTSFIINATNMIGILLWISVVLNICAFYLTKDYYTSTEEKTLDALQNNAGKVTLFDRFYYTCSVFILYPLISKTALDSQLSTFAPAYFFFFSALLITLKTDAKTFMISRLITLYLVPVGWLLSSFGYLPITPLESILGSLFGLTLLAGINWISRKFLGKDGLGQGDVDLMAFIGAFTGPFGCWVTLMLASILGSIFGLIYLAVTKQSFKNFKLPFGCFLALAAIIFVLFEPKFAALLLPKI